MRPVVSAIRTILTLLGCGAVALVHAQPDCAIDIGLDRVICQGTSATLNAPANFANRTWSTGETTPTISVNTAGDYWCEVHYPSGNLVTNGDFNGGNNGFTTQFNYSPDLWNEPNYFIATNASWLHPQFTGTGNGNFLMVNAGWQDPWKEIWVQDVPVCPEQTYRFSVRACSLSPSNPPQIAPVVDGWNFFPSFTPPTGPGVWGTYWVDWTSAPGQTSVRLSFVLTSGFGIGNDFGLDDISLSGDIVLRDEVHVDVTPLPSIALPFSQLACADEQVVLDATVAGATSYLWDDGSTAPTLTVTPANAGMHTVTVTANNCTNTDNANVTFTPVPNVELGNDTTLCLGGTLDLNASVSGGTYLWQDGSTGSHFVVSSTGDYHVRVRKGPCEVNDAIHVDFDLPPVVDLLGDQAICEGDPLTLDATVMGASYLWNDGTTQATHDAGTEGPYEVDVTLGACTVHDSIYVTANPIPVVNLGLDPLVCPGVDVTFDAAAPNATYAWSNGSTSHSITTDVPGPYSVDVTVDGCTGTGDVTLINFNLQSVDLGDDVTVCAPATVPLSVSVAGATFLWSTGETSDAITATATDDYWVDATLNGCTVRDSVSVTITPRPIFSLGTDPFVCPGATALLDATTANATYAWSDGSHAATLDAPVGSWNVTVTVDGCSSTDAADVIERTPPSIDLGNDTTICPGAQLVLDATAPGLSPLWDHGPTDAVITVEDADTYGVTVTDVFGCTGHDAIVVDHFVLPTVFIGNDTTLCSNALITLHAPAGADGYVWNNGSVGPELVAGGIGTYWVDVTYGTCVTTDSIDITTMAAPTVHLGNDTTLCPGATALLHAVASSGANMTWNDGTTGSDLLVSTANTYTVTATNSNNCTATDQLVVSYLDAANADLGSDTTLCPGATLLLSASLPNGTNLWSNGSAGPTLLVNAAGTYSVDISVSNCSFSSSIIVAYTDLPALDLGDDHDLCVGATVDLTAASAPGATFLWDDDSTDPVRTIHGGGTYWARAMLATCTTSDTIDVLDIALPVLELGNDTSLCTGADLPLDVQVAGGTYLWNNGSTSHTLDATPGEWNVLVVAHGCASRDTITIGTSPSPLLDFAGDTTLCEGATWTIDATQTIPGATYTWQDGSAASTFLVQQAGTYSVTADIAGCTTTLSATVDYFSPSSLELGDDTSLCPGATLLLQTGIANGSTTWQDGSSATSLLVHQAGTYRVRVDVGGCIAEDAVQVDYVPLITPALGNDRVLCEGDSLMLEVDAQNATVLWSDASSADSLIVRGGGTFTVTVSLEGCVASDAITITQRPMIDSIDLGADVRLCPGRSLTLDATTPGAAYNWNNGSNKATLTVITPGTYHVQINGPCILAADTIEVLEGDCAPVVFTPNAFTPDGDGINDGFAPVFTGNPIEYRFLVFNRWGGLIFTSATPGMPWDGMFGGEEAPQGVYVWTIYYRAAGDDGVTQVRDTGSVTLLR